MTDMDDGRRSMEPRPVLLLVAWREAWRNIASGTTHALAAALALGACVAVMWGADLMQINQLIDSADAYRTSGASTYAITLRNGIDAKACESLTDIDGVRAAGAIRQDAAKLAFASLPSTRMPTFDISPGAVGLFDERAASVLSPRDDGTGILLSRELADELGVRGGADIAFKNGEHTRARAIYDYPDDGRDSQYEYAALVPTVADGAFDTCMVSTWPVPDDIESLLSFAVVDSSSTDAGRNDRAQVSQLNPTLGSAAPKQSLFTARLTAPMPWLMLAVAAVLGFGMIRARRLEFASALHCGYPKPALTAQMLMELLVIAVCAVLLTTPLIAWTALVEKPVNLPALYNTLLRIPAAAMVGLVLGGTVAVSMTRERQLFAYFKNR